MKGLAVSIFQIFPVNRFLAGPAVLFYRDVITEFFELPEHLRSRNCEEKCRIEGFTFHSGGQVRVSADA